MKKKYVKPEIKIIPLYDPDELLACGLPVCSAYAEDEGLMSKPGGFCDDEDMEEEPGIWGNSGIVWDLDK